MKQFHTTEKQHPGTFSWPFSHPLSSTLDPYMVELRADSQVFQKAEMSVRPARQRSCGW